MRFREYDVKPSTCVFFVDLLYILLKISLFSQREKEKKSAKTAKKASVRGGMGSRQDYLTGRVRKQKNSKERCRQVLHV